jgi:hypothetical protein
MFTRLATLRTWSKGRNHKQRSCKPLVETLEDRNVPSGFIDGFEGPSLDPFWNHKTQVSGTIAPTTALPHSGQQSLQMQTVNTSSNKYLFLGHNFADPTYGRVEVWVYDNGADVSSSNYLFLTLYNSAENKRAFIGTFDYDLGAGNGGDVYYFNNWAPQHSSGGIRSGIDRTQGWHHWEIESTPQHQVLSIDNQVVYSSAAGLSFDQLHISTSGPSWRPPWNGFFDDFAFVEYGDPDLAPTALAWNPAQGGVDFGYKVRGADLTEDTTAALFWSADDKFDAGDTLAYDTKVERPQGDYGPFYVPNSVLNLSRPANATHLVLVLDPDKKIAESEEKNNEKALALPDLAAKALLYDGRGFMYAYSISGADLPADSVEALFWSSNDTYEPGIDKLAASFPIQGADRRVGAYSRSIVMSKSLGYPVGATHLLLVLDPDDAITELNEKNNVKALKLIITGEPGRGDGDDDPPGKPIVIPLPDPDERRKKTPPLNPLPPWKPPILKLPPVPGRLGHGN